MTVKIAVLQICSGIDPARNCADIIKSLHDAAGNGAAILFTPEMAVLLDSDRRRSAHNIHTLADDPSLKAICDAAKEAGIAIHIGSMALSGGAGARRRNCGLWIDKLGRVQAHYDKIHLFDADLPTGESWKESNAYAPGNSIAVVDGDAGRLGLSICYDMRFPALYQKMSEAGATTFAVPAAFTVPTGKAHWHSLLRARAIENGAYVIAAAQSGKHEDGRSTYGHSLVIDPWGEVLLDMESELGLGFADIDPELVLEVRRRIPILSHRVPLPEVTVF